MSLNAVRSVNRRSIGTVEDKSSRGEFEPSPWHKRLLRWLITVPTEETEGQEEGQEKHTRRPITRNYQKWSSNKQIFILGGRFRVLRAAPVSLATFTVILIPGVLFGVFDASWTWHNLHPGAVIMFYYCWMLCLVSFVKAAGYDPGFVPRNIHLTDDPYMLPEEYFNVISLPSSNGTRSVDVRYCSTCRDWRMPRSFHCSKCDECVSVHDHHCKWLNNCVGERNYRFFFGFLLFGVLSCSFMCSMCYYHILKSDVGVKRVPMSLFNVIYGHLAMLYPLLLLVYHVYFCATNQTTREFLRTFRTSQKRTKPFTLDNIFKNFAYSLAKPRGVSYLQPRAAYEEGDFRLERYERSH